MMTAPDVEQGERATVQGEVPNTFTLQTALFLALDSVPRADLACTAASGAAETLQLMAAVGGQPDDVAIDTTGTAVIERSSQFSRPVMFAL